MPYRMLEELQSRKKEKVAMFLTFENIVGLILLGFSVLIGSASLPLLVRAPLVAGTVLLGVFLILEAQSLPIYERVLWSVRGMIRIRTTGGILAPEDLARAVRTPTQERALASSLAAQQLTMRRYVLYKGLTQGVFRDAAGVLT